VKALSGFKNSRRAVPNGWKLRTTLRSPRNDRSFHEFNYIFGDIIARVKLAEACLIHV